MNLTKRAHCKITWKRSSTRDFFLLQKGSFCKRRNKHLMRLYLKFNHSIKVPNHFIHPPSMLSNNRAIFSVNLIWRTCSTNYFIPLPFTHNTFPMYIGLLLKVTLYFVSCTYDGWSLWVFLEATELSALDFVAWVMICF